MKHSGKPGIQIPNNARKKGPDSIIKIAAKNQPATTASIRFSPICQFWYILSAPILPNRRASTSAKSKAEKKEEERSCLACAKEPSVMPGCAAAVIMNRQQGTVRKDLMSETYRTDILYSLLTGKVKELFQADTT